MAKKAICSSLFFFVLLSALGCLAADFSGLWWDESKPGQGVSIIQKNNSICGAWYLYDEYGKDMWLVFTGSLTSDNSFTSELLQYTGPALGTPWDINKLKATSRGSVTITFNGPERAIMRYRLGLINGTLNLKPFANDDAVMYWDKNKQGQGLSFFLEGSKVYLVWYLYDKNGRNMWLTSGTDLDINSNSGYLYRFRGPPFGSTWDTSLLTSTIVGTAAIAFSDPEIVQFYYNIEGVWGQLDLSPFVCKVSQCSRTSSDSYEGIATVFNAENEDCSNLARVIMVVCGNTISGEAVNDLYERFLLSGTVDSKGTVSGTIYLAEDLQENNPVGSFLGTLAGNTLRGSWRDSWGCYGTFSLVKTHAP